MPAHSKINLEELERLYREGNSVTEMAAMLGVSKGAVSKRCKELGLAIAQDICLRSAEKINSRKITALDRVNGLVAKVEAEIDQLEDDLEGKEGDDKIPLLDMKLKHLAEARRQMALILEISKTLFSIESVQQFQQLVLETLGEIDEEARKRFLDKLRTARSYKHALGSGEPGI